MLYELEVGIAWSSSPESRRRQLQDLTSVAWVLPFGYEEAHRAAVIRADLERQGLPIGPYDILIAGVAPAHNHILVTRNIKEFSRIQGLRLEDWYG